MSGAAGGAPRRLRVTEADYAGLIERLAVRIHRSGWQFDTILCLARGGLRPGDVLSRIFRVPLAIMSTSSYRAEGGTVRGHLDLARFITTPHGELAGRVLVVDDLADTGHTLAAVMERLLAGYPAIREMRSAVLWVKASSTFEPDYHVVRLPDDPWIDQPFEAYDTVSPQSLLARHPNED